MDKKYGVFICTGCGIGEALDIEALADVAKEEALPVQTHPFLCSKEGVALAKIAGRGKARGGAGYRAAHRARHPDRLDGVPTASPGTRHHRQPDHEPDQPV